MKKILAITSAILCLATTASAELYCRFGRVTGKHRGLVTVTDRGENDWGFWGDADGVVILLMDDQGTAEITDDVIINVF